MSACVCICMYSRSKKNKENAYLFNTNYRKEMKLVPIIIDYCPLKFDALKISLARLSIMTYLPLFCLLYAFL